MGTFLTTPIYRASVTLKIDDENSSLILFQNTMIARQAPEEFLQTQYKILKSRNLAKRVIYALGVDTFEPKAKPSQKDAQKPATREDVSPEVVNNFLQKVSVSPVSNTRLVMVSFDSPKATVAAATANEIAKAFKELNTDSKSESTQWARDWLTKQLADMKVKVEQSEATASKYASQHDMPFELEEMASRGRGGFTAAPTVSSDRLVYLSSQLVQATTDRISKELLLREAQQGDPLLLSAFAANPLVEAVRKEYVSKESEYAKLSTVYRSDHPKMIRLKEEMAGFRKRIDAETRTHLGSLQKEYTVALKKESFFKSALDEHKRGALNLHDKMVQHQILKRDAETNKQLYDGILQRLKETNISADLAKSIVQVLDRADVPGVPFKPDRKKSLLNALMIGLLGGIGLALVVNYLDNTIKTPDEVEKTLLLPSLGIVPRFQKQPNSDDKSVVMSTTNDKPSPAVEAYRSIGTYIQFSSPGHPPKVILITSARHSEGKSTTCVNLGASLANSYGKGIVIDGDLRKPNLHHMFEVSNSGGLTAYLTGHLELDKDLIQESGIPGLDLITAGIIPPNPSELLSSSRMKDLISALRPLYSFIIIDGPPVLGLSDSLVLSTVTDGVIMVVKAAETPRDSVAQAKKLIRGVNGRILGVILNAIRETDLRYGQYSYYYSYYYYGYGYGQGNGKEKRRWGRSRSNEGRM
jgi:capsular exopolysaccharide synthesis family protein